MADAPDNTQPTDLSRQAVQVARRLQALPDNRVYNLTIVKTGQEWILAITDANGAKPERIGK
jgi:hypothetical protein